MKTREAASELKVDYAIQGWGEEAISVRVKRTKTKYVSDGLIFVTIKDPKVPYKEAARMAEELELVGHSNEAGEVFVGGGRAVEIKQSRKHLSLCPECKKKGLCLWSEWPFEGEIRSRYRCRYCEHEEVTETANICPHCGQGKRRHGQKEWECCGGSDPPELMLKMARRPGPRTIGRERNQGRSHEAQTQS